MSHLATAIEGEIGRMTFQRPEKRNAITAEMWDEMVSGLAALGQDENVRALVITGAGGSFSAGADLEAVRGADGTRPAAYQDKALKGVAAVRDFPRPTLALIDGPCIGGGCSIALACDVRFASPDSVFSIPAVRYGFTYDDGSLMRLVELLGSGQACRFMFSAMKLSGRDAAEIGLVELCSDDPAAAADAYLAALASADVAAVDATRTLIRRFAGLDLRAELAARSPQPSDTSA